MRLLTPGPAFLFVSFLAGCGASVTPGTGADAAADVARTDVLVSDAITSPDVIATPDATSRDAVALPDVVTTIDVVTPPPDVISPPPDVVTTIDVVTPPPDVVSPPADVVTPRDTGFPIEPDGAVMYPPDAGYDPGVVCGTSVCTGTQSCCVNTRTRALECVAAGTCMGISATCDGPEDCPTSQTCCLTGTGATQNLTCNAASACSRLPLIGTVMPCHTRADCPASASICCNVSGLGGFGGMLPAGIPSVCAPFCPGG